MVNMESLVRVCLDTDVLIDYMRKPSDAVKRIMKGALDRKVSVCTTSVNTFEIWLGAHLAPKKSKLIEDTKNFLDHLEVVNFEYETSIEAGRVMASLRRSGRVVEIRDLFVGCICKVDDMPLLLET